MLTFFKKLIPVHYKDYLKKQILLIKNRGDKFICPCCNYSSKTLALIGENSEINKTYKVIGAGRRNGECLKCGSADRVRLIYTYLQYEIDFFNKCKNRSVLHIAPEKQISEKFIDANFPEYICGDLFTEGYSYPDYVTNMNILNLPFQNNSFDLILCNHVLEHVPADIAAMKELYRVLKTGGTAILQVPISKTIPQTIENSSITDPKERELTFGQHDHVRIYGCDYKNRLESVGFTVETINISEKYQKFGLISEEDIFIARKKLGN
jgi:predicted SAM-dependent methyltransferase